MKKEDFYGTFWDVSEWTKEQKIQWQQRCFELGFSWVKEPTTTPKLLRANTYFLENSVISYSDNCFRTNSCPIEKHYEDMFPEQPEEKLDVVAEIVKLVHEAQSAEEEEDDSFEGLVYVAPEEGQPDSKYFAILRRNCSDAQWNHILENCPTASGELYGTMESLQICSGVSEWFDNDEVYGDDIIVSFNDIFQYPKGD